MNPPRHSSHTKLGHRSSSRRWRKALPHLRRAWDTASMQAGSPDHGVHILRAQNKYLKVEGKKNTTNPLLFSESKFSVFALGFEADTDRNMTKEMQVSANHEHISSDGFQMPALLQDKFPPGQTPDNLDSPRGLQVCSPCRHVGLQQAHLLVSPPPPPSTPGNAQAVMGDKALPTTLSKTVKTASDPQGHVFCPCLILRECTRLCIRVLDKCSQIASPIADQITARRS